MDKNSTIPVLQKLRFSVIQKVLCYAIPDTVSQVFIIIILFAAIEGNASFSRNQLFAMFVILVILRHIIKRRFDVFVVNLIEDKIFNIRSKTMDAVRKTSFIKYEQIGIEQIYTVLTNDLKAISDISQSISLTTRMLSITVGLLIYFFILSQAGFTASLIVIIVIASSSLYTHSREMKAIQDVREQEKKLFESFDNLLLGFKQLRLNAAKNDAFFQQCIKPCASQLRENKQKSNYFFIWMYTLSYGITIFLITTGALLIPLLKNIPHTEALKILSLVIYIPVCDLMYGLMNLTLANVSMERFRILGETLQEITSEEDFSDQMSGLNKMEFKELHFKNIHFQYDIEDNHAFSVGPLSLKIYAGEILFIIGGNGSGKSTLLKLMTGLYPIHSGQILLNGTSVLSHQFRHIFSPVFQDFYLFDRLYGLKDINESHLNYLLKSMHLQDQVKFKDRQFSSLDLSTGQRKRLALIISIMDNKPIFLFDEWAAEQDPYFRKYYYETLLPELKIQGKTIIAITHDDNYFHIADRMLEMKYGQIVEY